MGYNVNIDKNPRGLILLTYKGKMLLMYKSTGPGDENTHPWCFISAVKNKKESFEMAMGREVEEEMGIKIENIECIVDSYYHAKLTDDNVNEIERQENHTLAFFSPKEIQKLSLSNSTQEFILKFGFEEIRSLSSNL